MRSKSIFLILSTLFSCVVLNINLQLTKKNISVKKATWLTSSSANLTSSYIGVLYSDNILR